MTARDGQRLFLFGFEKSHVNTLCLRYSQYVIDDPCISNKHLRVYTILFDRDNPGEVTPLVYVQDLSMNGTTWNDYQMGKGSGSFLLSHGDMLKLTPDVYLVFRCEEHVKQTGFDMLQKVEMKVRFLRGGMGVDEHLCLLRFKGVSGSVYYYAAKVRFRGLWTGAYGI